MHLTGNYDILSIHSLNWASWAPIWLPHLDRDNFSREKAYLCCIHINHNGITFFVESLFDSQDRLSPFLPISSTASYSDGTNYWHSIEIGYVSCNHIVIRCLLPMICPWSVLEWLCVGVGWNVRPHIYSRRFMVKNSDSFFGAGFASALCLSFYPLSAPRKTGELSEVQAISFNEDKAFRPDGATATAGQWAVKCR